MIFLGLVASREFFILPNGRKLQVHSLLTFRLSQIRPNKASHRPGIRA
jgi:hypothetical protein